MIRYLLFYKTVGSFLLLLVGCFQLVKAQLPYIKAVPYPYQIPTKTIYDIFTDNKGQIWLGTNKGLYRFNGKDATEIPFKTTRQKDITYLKEDDKGRIWGMNFANQIFYIENDSLHLFHVPTQLIGSLINFEVLDNVLWVCTSNEVAGFELTHKKTIFKHTFNDYLYDFKVYHSTVFIGTEAALYQIDSTKKLTKLSNSSQQVSRWVATNQQLILGNREQNRKVLQVKPHLQSLPDLQLPDSVVIYHYKSTKDGKLWICTKQGGWLWNEKTGHTSCLFPDKQVTGVVQDYQNNYWISTLDDGLWFCPSLAATVNVPIQELAQQNVDITRIHIAQEPHFYWIGTTNGKVYHTKLDSPKDRKIYKNDNYRKEITTLIFDTKTQQVISSAGIFSQKNTTLKNTIGYPKNAVLFGNKILAAYSGAAGWILLQNLSQEYEVQKKLFGIKLDSQITHAIQIPIYPIRNQRAYGVALDSVRKKYWVGYADDLYEYDLKGNFKIIRTATNEPITAAALCTDQQGNLYVASFNQGLFVIKNQRIIKQLGRYNLLKTNECKHIYNYNDTIWVGTTQSIGYLSAELDCFTDVLSNGGLSGLSYQHFTVQENLLLIATDAAIITLPLHNDGKTHLDTLRLLPAKVIQQNNNINIQVEALNYKSASNNRFYYRLVGIDNDWKPYNDITLLLNYSQLKAGKYDLELYAMDMLSGVRSNVLKVSFHVPKKWWETSVFYVLLLCSVAVLGWFSFSIWIKRYKNKQSLQEQLWISQLKAIRAQMNPHFLYNILNTAQGLVYSNRRTEAASLLGNFSDLIRKTLEVSEQPYISLKEEIKNLTLYLYLEKVRFEEAEFSYEMNYKNAMTWSDQQIPSMLIQPFVENAIKHGLLHKKGEKKLTILFQEMNEKKLLVRIEDNGIGRQNAAQIRARQAKPSTGFATSAIQQRIELLNKIGNYRINYQIIDKINNEQAEGTVVEITIEIGD